MHTHDLLQIESARNVTCIASYNEHLYIGADLELLHFLYDSVSNTYILASRHPFNAAITSICLFPDVNVIAILASRNVSFYAFPEVSPGTVRKIGAVHGIARYGNKILVLSGRLVRIIELTRNGRLEKDIDYPNAMAALALGDYACVVGQEDYDLIDLIHSRKIPLFPTGGHCLIAVVTDNEFLVVVGTDSEAMGMIIDLNGEIRRGTITFDRLPSRVVVDFPNVMAFCESSIDIYNIETSAKEVLPLEGLLWEARVDSTPVYLLDGLVDRIKLVTVSGKEDKAAAEDYARVSSSVLIARQSLSHVTISAVATSFVFRIEDLIKDKQYSLAWNELQRDFTSEKQYHENTYLSQFFLLSMLHDDAVKASGYLFETSLDPRIIISLWRDIDISEIWVYHGLLPKLKRIGGSEEILEAFLLQYREKKGFASIENDPTIFSKIDETLVQMMISRTDQLYSLLDSGVDCFDEAVSLLTHHNKWYALSHVYQSCKQATKVLEVWKSILDGTHPDSEFHNGKERFRDYLLRVRDDELVWRYAKWLVQYDFVIGVDLILKRNFGKERVLDVLEGEAEKLYLESIALGPEGVKYRGRLVDVYCECMEEIDYSQYDRAETLSRWVARKDENVHKLVALLNMDWQYDAAKILQKVSGPLERAALLGRQGRHREAISEYMRYGDYISAESYCAGATENLFPTLLESYLVLKPPKLEIVTDLIDRWGRYIDVLDVLRLIPDSWSVDLLSRYLLKAIVRLVRERREVGIWKGLERNCAERIDRGKHWTRIVT